MNVAVLHDEVARLKAELAQTQEALAHSEEARRRLESIVSDFQREKFGKHAARAALWLSISASSFSPLVVRQ